MSYNYLLGHSSYSAIALRSCAIALLLSFIIDLKLEVATHKSDNKSFTKILLE